MPKMTDLLDNSCPSDIRLLLRCHGEQLWLNCQVRPVLRELDEADAIPEDELGAALAYLEVLWIDARRLANETEAASAALLASEPELEVLRLRSDARRYHAAVRAMRDALARQFARLTSVHEGPPAQQHATL
jgi:hypothetical protein